MSEEDFFASSPTANLAGDNEEGRAACDCFKGCRSFVLRSLFVLEMKSFCLVLTILAVLNLTACLPGPTAGPSGSGVTITLYGFSIMKEPLEKAIFIAFKEKWKR